MTTKPMPILDYINRMNEIYGNGPVSKNETSTVKAVDGTSPGPGEIKNAQKKHLKKLIKFGLEESQEAVIKNPVMRNALEPKPKRDHYKHLVETGKILEPTKEEIERSKQPSTWDLIYQDMSPIKKAQHNYLQRKKGYNGKTGEKINAVKYKPKKEQWKYESWGDQQKEPLVKQFRNDDPTTYLTDENQQKGMLIETLEDAKPKKKINAYADVKIEVPTIDHLLLRNSNQEAREAALEKTRLYAFATRPDPDAARGIGSFKNTIARDLRAANSKSEWESNLNHKYKDNKNGNKTNE